MKAHALLFTDVVDSTRMVERLGDIRAADVWAEHDRRARDLLDQHHGREIGHTDGFFLLFDEAIDAARYALAYHQALAGLALHARAGLHVGPVTLRKNTPEDIARGAANSEAQGLATPFTARVMGLAGAGQTLLSRAARDTLADTLPAGTEVESHGYFRLKGVEEPVEIFELGLRGSSAFTPPADVVKAYRVVRAGDFWRPVREVHHNLPAERDTFVGRSAELRALAVKLDAGSRVLTILGPGGTGKTRFVRRYGHSWLGDWPGGVYFCDLSEARSLDGVYFAAAVALGVPLGKDDPGVQLGHAIAARGRCLVILDNFEQVQAHAQATLGRWLDRAADAAFLATSRERLHIPGEEIFPLEPLTLEKDAIDLFAARAAAQRPGFVVNETNHAAVAEVVRLLDGLPLAIELAAARARMFSPAQLVERMRDRFGLLAGARGSAARQATLRAAIDWSWDLLTPWEQAAFAQCSVFEGGFTLEAAEAVLDLARWPDAAQALDTIQALVDKSLLRSWVPIDQGRYDLEDPYFGMYLSIHEYASEKLGAGNSETKSGAEQRHGRYFATFGTDDALEALHERDGIRRHQALAIELDNIVVACRRAIAKGHGDIAAATYRAAWEVLDRRGPFALGVDLGVQVTALGCNDTSLLIAACVNLGLASRRIGRTAEAETLLVRALARAREARDRRSEALVLDHLGLVRYSQGRIDEAISHTEETLAIQREVGNRRLEGSALYRLGNYRLMAQGRMDDAQADFEAALAIHRDLGDRRAEGAALSAMAVLCQDQGRMEEARGHYDVALAIEREVGDRLAEGIVLGNLGTLHNDLGRLGEARADYEAALAIHREIGDRFGEAVTLGNLGKLSIDQGRNDEARTHYLAELAIARETGSRREEGIALGMLGVLDSNQGRWDEARIHYEAALAVHREVGNRRFEGEVLGNLGELLARQGLASEAYEALNAGEALLREIDDPLDLAKLLCLRGQAEAAFDKPDAARAALAEAEAVAVALDAQPESELRREIARLRDALA